MKKASLSLLLFLVVASCCNCYVQGSPDIIVTVDTPPASAPDVSSLLWGHNIRFLNDGEFFWYTADTVRGIGQIKTEVLDELRAAASSQASVLRYPGGAHGDTNRWRTGVGNFKHIEQGDLDERREYSETWQEIPKFGTDEVVAFAHEVSDKMKPIMQVNWWFFNKPGASQLLHDQGKQEAANFVEYCNQTVELQVTRDCLVEGHGEETHTILPSLNDEGWAVHESWTPSVFRDGPSRSTAYYAQETADGTHSWLSYGTHASSSDPPCYEQGYYNVPKGYFAWLRRYFAWERLSEDDKYDEYEEPTWKSLTAFPESDYHAPYGITHWEIGSEIYGDSTLAAAYNAGVRAYSEAMKRANDINGQLDANKVEVNPYGSRLKIGACMDDSTCSSPLTAY